MVLRRQDPAIGERVKMKNLKTNDYAWAKVTKVVEAWIYALVDGEEKPRAFFRSQCANSYGQHVYD